MTNKIKLIIIGGIVAACFIFGFIRFQNVLASDEFYSVSFYAIRNEQSATFINSGLELSPNQRRVSLASAEKFANDRRMDYSMDAELRFAFMQNGNIRQITSRIHVYFDSKTNTYTYTVSNSGDLDEKSFEGFWAENGIHTISETENHELLSQINMANFVFFNHFTRSEAVGYGLWGGEMFYRQTDNAGYEIFAETGTELRLFENRPVYYRYCGKLTNTDIERLFTVNFYYHPEVSIRQRAEITAAVNRARNLRFFSGRAQELTQNEITDVKRQIEDFMQNNTGYRMDGEFRYNYYTHATSFVNFYSNITMSYNQELDVYKFEIKSTALSFNAFIHPHLAPYYTEDGVYYIIRENGVVYILSEINGTKRVTPAESDMRLYNLLMGYTMPRLIDTSYLADVRQMNDVNNLHLRDSNYIYRSYNDGNYSYGNFTLLTYKNIPVLFRYDVRPGPTGMNFNFALNFHYDRIPSDNPAVVGWR